MHCKVECRSTVQILGNIVCSRVPARCTLYEVYLSRISDRQNEVSGGQGQVHCKVECRSTVQILGNIVCSRVPARCTLYEVYLSRINDR